MSCIHYKFKSSLDYNSITFDGLHLSLADLKKAISLQKRLKPGEFDLEIMNAQTGDVYKKGEELIAKNTSVIVSRVPVNRTTASSTQKSWEAFKQECAKVKEKEKQMTLEKLKQTPDLAAAPASEIDKIKAVIDQSTKGFEQASFVGKQHLADYYVCRKCGQKGHYVSHCPNKPEERIVEQRVKRTTGIPSTMLTIVDDPLHPGALLTHQGQFAVPTVDVEAYRESKKEKPPFLPSDQNMEAQKRKIPQELLCHICEDLCVDAAIAPCCGTSFCDECLREVLLESEDHQCPSCHETNVSPDRIVANRSMRLAVTNFLNDTGYTKVKRRRSAGGDIPPTPEAVVPPSLSNISSMQSKSASVGNVSQTNPTIPASSSAGAQPHANAPQSKPSDSHRESQHIHRPDHRSRYPHSSFHQKHPAPPHVPRFPEGSLSKPWLDHEEPSAIATLSGRKVPPSQRLEVNPIALAQATQLLRETIQRNSFPPANESMALGSDRSSPGKQAAIPGIKRAQPLMERNKRPESLNQSWPINTALATTTSSMANLRGHPLPIITHPPPGHLPFTAIPGYMPFPRMGMPIIPPSVTPQPAPLSKVEFYKAQKMMQSADAPKRKPVDVFDSFADYTKRRSRSPERRRSSSRSRSGSRPKRGSRSQTPPYSTRRSRSLSRGRSPPLRSRSRSIRRSLNRSLSRSPGRLSKIRSRSKSPRLSSKPRSRSRSGHRLSKAHSRSLSPLLTRRPSKSSLSPRRSSRSPLPLRRSSKSSLPRRSSKSPLSPRRSSKSPLTPRRSSKSPLPPRRSSKSPLPLRRSSKSPLPWRSSKSPPPRRSSKSPLPRRSSKSPLPRRSSKSPLSLRRSSKSPFSPRRSSKSPRPLRSRSRSLRRSPRSRSRSWERRRSFSRNRSPRPLSRSPRRSPRFSPLPKRRYSPRHRSTSFSPRRLSPFRSRSRTPLRKRSSRSRSLSPLPKRRSFTPSPSRRSRSPFRKRPLSPIARRRTPSPFYRGRGGFRGRNHGGYRDYPDRDNYRRMNSPPKGPRPDESQQSFPTGNLPPVPYFPGMGLPPPEEYFKYNPAGYEEFVRRFYSQFGTQAQSWVQQQGQPMPQLPAPEGFSQGIPPPASVPQRPPWESVPMSPSQRPRSLTPNRDHRNPGPRDPNHGYRDGSNRHWEKDRERYRQDRDRDRDKDRRFDRDREMDRHRRDVGKDRGKDSDRNRDRGGDRNKDKDVDKNRDRDADKSRNREGAKEVHRSREKTSLERRRSPVRKSKEEDKDKTKDKKKDKKREERDGKKSKKRVVSEGKKGKEDSKNTTKTSNVSDKNSPVKKTEQTYDDQNDAKEQKPTDDVTAASESVKNVPSKEANGPTSVEAGGKIEVKEKKTVMKKKATGTTGKKGKAKDAAAEEGAGGGEKKIKKTKKKKPTFGSSDADNKQGLKKKKLKRLVDYKSENCNSEDGDDRAALGGSPFKKPKQVDSAQIEEESVQGPKEESSQSSHTEAKAEATVEAKFEGETDEAQSNLNSNDSKHASPEEVVKPLSTASGDGSSALEKEELVPEMPELSKWERDDFDLLDTLEKPKEKPQPKMMLPRSVVDKAEKFLTQKPMKNSVIAAPVTSSKSMDPAFDNQRSLDSRAKSPVSKTNRKVFLDPRKEGKDKKSLDIQVTVKTDKRRESSDRRAPASSKSSGESHRHHHRHNSGEYEEDQRSVVKSTSLERELQSKPLSKSSHREKQDRKSRTSTDEKDGKKEATKKSKESSSKDKDHQTKRDKSPHFSDHHHSKGSSTRKSNEKPVKDLRQKIEEKSKAKTTVDHRKLSVMDEAEFVPDYEDLAPDSTSDNEHDEHTSQTSGGSSPETETKKRKRSDEDGKEETENGEDDDEGESKSKKAKKKHKHKEKKEKHKKAKKKKHKKKKSKEKSIEDSK